MGRTGIAPGDDGRCALRADRPAPEPGPGRPVRLRRAHPRRRPRRPRTAVARAGIEQTLRAPRPTAREGPASPPDRPGRDADLPDPRRRSTCPGVECSPGTCTLHDVGYATDYPDLPFSPAAALLTRVISRPRPGRLCLDVGHKAVAADPVGAAADLARPPRRDARRARARSTWSSTRPTPADSRPGPPFLALPTHICPTCALHRRAYVVENGGQVDEWEVTARDRVLRF